VGVERPVTRWFLQHDSLTKEIAALEAKLMYRHTAQSKAQQEELLQQLAHARARLLALGPCPKPMMG
jgi:hypothetical protein